MKAQSTVYIPLTRNAWPWILGPLLIGNTLGVSCQFVGRPVLSVVFYVLAVSASVFMVYFHRDPARVPPARDDLVLAGADGRIRRVERMQHDSFPGEDVVRISIFLSPFNVHVNRSPLAGKVSSLAYTPGRHLFTIQDASSEVNEHSSILIEGRDVKCLVKQIVGPIVRRVVYWLETGQILTKGEELGMMRFGSRLDIYLPASRVEVQVQKGDRVKAGETVVATINRDVKS